MIVSLFNVTLSYRLVPAADSLAPDSLAPASFTQSNFIRREREQTRCCDGDRAAAGYESKAKRSKEERNRKAKGRERERNRRARAKERDSEEQQRGRRENRERREKKRNRRSLVVSAFLLLSSFLLHCTQSYRTLKLGTTKEGKEKGSKHERWWYKERVVVVRER